MHLRNDGGHRAATNPVPSSFEIPCALYLSNKRFAPETKFNKKGLTPHPSDHGPHVISATTTDEFFDAIVRADFAVDTEPEGDAPSHHAERELHHMRNLLSVGANIVHHHLDDGKDKRQESKEDIGAGRNSVGARRHQRPHEHEVDKIGENITSRNLC